MKTRYHLLTLLAGFIGACYEMAPQPSEPDASDEHGATHHDPEMAPHPSASDVSDGHDPVDDDDRCGETTRTGYLVPGFACVSVIPELVDYRSKEGHRCWLDVFVSDDEAEDFMPDDCDEAPTTSLCFLERLGMLEDVMESPQEFPKVTLEGYMEKVEVCRNQNKLEEDKECEDESVFIPCEAVAI